MYKLNIYLKKKKKKILHFTSTSIPATKRGKTTPPHSDRERDKVNRE